LTWHHRHVTDTGNATIPREARRARLAVAALFLTNAVLYGNLVPRFPEVRDGLGLTNASFGTALAAAPVGALAAGLFAPVLIRWFGSARLASIGMVTLAGSLFAVSLTGRWITLALVFLVMGALDGVIDVAQNAHGFRVQRIYGRSIINAFHGMWSIGAVLGGLTGAVAAGLEVSLGVHFGAVAIVFSGVALVAYTQLLTGPEDAERLHTEAATPPVAAPAVVDEMDSTTSTVPAGTIPARPVLLLGLLGVLTIAAAVVEDAGASWSAIYLRDELTAGAAAAGLGFVSMQVAMTLGRLTGDRFVDRWGQAAVARAGGVLIIVGMGAAIAAPSVVGTLAGFATAGLGVATVVPAAMHVADELPGLSAGVGLTVVSWTLRVGFLVSPPIVGAIADAVSLRAAMLGVPLAGITIVVLAGSLRSPVPGDDPAPGAT
jgi:Na+/melibiose symporter-like transporter